MLHVNENTIDAYKQKTRAQIKEMKANIQLIEARAEKAGADVRIQYQNKLKGWKSRLEAVESELNGLSDSTQEAWDIVRSGIDNALSELSDSFENARKQFDD